jgi:hypothetical protein
MHMHLVYNYFQWQEMHLVQITVKFIGTMYILVNKKLFILNALDIHLK